MPPISPLLPMFASVFQTHPVYHFYHVWYSEVATFLLTLDGIHDFDFRGKECYVVNNLNKYKNAN